MRLAPLRAWATASLLVIALIPGCKQGEGDRCQLDSDCEDGLVCCVDPAHISEGGVCREKGKCDVPPVDSGSDTRPVEAGPDLPPPDKGTPDKGAPDTGAPDTGAPDKGTPDTTPTPDQTSVDTFSVDTAPAQG